MPCSNVELFTRHRRQAPTDGAPTHTRSWVLDDRNGPHRPVLAERLDPGLDGGHLCWFGRDLYMQRCHRREEERDDGLRHHRRRSTVAPASSEGTADRSQTARSTARRRYRHPSRQAIFVGDLIDRGRRTTTILEIVKAMVALRLGRATESPTGSGSGGSCVRTTVGTTNTRKERASAIGVPPGDR